MTDTVSGSKPTPPAVQAVYFPRGMLEMLDIPVLERIFFYELIDDTTLTGKESSFGLFQPGAGDTVIPKASAQAIARLVALYSDPGGAFAEGVLPLKVGNAPNLRWRLHARQNSKFLLSMWRNELIYDPATQQTLTVADVNVTVSLPPTVSTVVHRITPGTVSSAQSGPIVVPIGADLTVLEVTV
jgi:hypothetical protein